MVKDKGKLSERIFIRGSLRFQDPFHVGTGSSSLATDNLLARDTGGEIFIPGTSMCGAVRGHLEKYYGPGVQDVVDRYFGGAGHEDKSISRVFIEDSYPSERIDRTAVRDGVAIRRDYATARDRGKYDYEMSPREARMGFAMRVDFRQGDPDAEDMKQVLKTLVRDLKQGRIRVGGNKTRGMGLCELKDVRIGRMAFSARDLKAYLLNGGEGEAIDEDSLTSKEALSPGVRTMRIAIECSVDGPFLVKDGMRSEAETFVEKTTADGAKHKKETDAYFVKSLDSAGKPVPAIPGGSIKGVFRSRAEKIVRLLGEASDACDPTDIDGNCAGRIKSALKGPEKTAAAPGAGRSEEGPSDDRFQTIVANSCFTCNMFGNTYLASKVFFADSVVENPVRAKYDGVAINRFTAGPVEAALFNAMPLVKGDFSVRIDAVDLTNEQTALLLFVVKDFKNGNVPLPLGFGKNKGYGRIRVDSVAVDAKSFDEFVADNEPVFKDWRKYWEAERETS